MENTKTERSIGAVLNLQTGELLEAEELFSKPEQREAEIFQLRTSLEEYRQRDEALYVCIYCKHPVGIRGRKNRQHYYFAHTRDGDDCHIKTGTQLSREQIQCIKYNGVKESEKHQWLKGQLANLLEQDPLVQQVDIEKVYRDTTISNAWKKPDILARLADKSIAFELQLSTTFLSVIVSRALFYKEHKVFLIWIFSDFSIENDMQKFTQKDVYYTNYFQVYVFDKEAQQQSMHDNQLVLKCYYQSSVIKDNIVRQKWEVAFISIHDLNWNEQDYSFFYYDSVKEKLALELQLKQDLSSRKELKEIHNAEVKATRAVAYLRRLYQSMHMIKPQEWEEDPANCNTELEIQELNKKLGFSGAKAHVIATLFHRKDRIPFLKYICTQDEIELNFTNMRIDDSTVFEYIIYLVDVFFFLNKIILLFQKGYQMTTSDYQAFEGIFGKNYFNTSNSERANIERWAYIYGLNGVYVKKDVIHVKEIRQVLFAILSLKHDLSIGYKYDNLRQYAIHFLKYNPNYGKVFIRAMQQYKQYTKLLKEDKTGKLAAALDNFTMRHESQITGYNHVILQIFPELHSESSFF
jgi:hypothetical protein